MCDVFVNEQCMPLVAILPHNIKVTEDPNFHVNIGHMLVPFSILKAGGSMSLEPYPTSPE